MRDECEVKIMGQKFGVDINLLLSKEPSERTHYGGIGDLIEVYLEEKLAIEVLLHHSLVLGGN